MALKNDQAGKLQEPRKWELEFEAATRAHFGDLRREFSAADLVRRFGRHAAREIHTAWAPRVDSKHWVGIKCRWGDLLLTLLHPTAEHKGEKYHLLFVPGDLHRPGEFQCRRVEDAIRHLDCATLDLDAGDAPFELACERVKALGLTGAVYRSPSDQKTESLIPLKPLIKNGGALTVEACAKHLAKHASYTPEIWGELEIIDPERNVTEDVDYQRDGKWHKETVTTPYVVVRHRPIAKTRIVILLADRFERRRGEPLEAFKKRWAGCVINPLAKALRFKQDRAALDVTRAFYVALVGADLSICNDELLDIDADFMKQAREALEAEGPKVRASTSSSSSMARTEGRSSSSQSGVRYRFADLMCEQCLDKVRNDKRPEKGLVEIECPFDDEHSNAGDPCDVACMASNEGAMYCQHSHDAGQEGGHRTHDYVKRMIELGWFNAETLERYRIDGEDGAVPPSTLTKDEVRALIKNLSAEYTSDDLAPIIDAMARINDPTFDAEGIRLLKAPPAKIGTGVSGGMIDKAREKLTEAKKEEYERARKTSLGAGTEGCRRYAYWMKQPPTRTLLDVASHLEKQNEGDNPELFARGADYVRAMVDSNGKPYIDILDVDALTYECNKTTVWEKHNENGEFTHYVDAPKEVVKKLLKHPMRLPKLVRVSNTPFFSSDHKLIAKAGYHRKDGVLYIPTQGLEIPEVPLDPSRAVVREALWWAACPFRGFSFNDGWGPKTGTASLANHMAKLVQHFARPMIDGPTPIYATTKTEFGEGASLLTRATSQIILGTEPKTETSKGDNAEEWRKTLATYVVEGDTYVTIDNADGLFADKSVAAQATALEFSDRLLGVNKRVSGPVNWIFEVNGVGMRFPADLARRVCLVRLDSEMAKPSEGRTFKHDGEDALVAWIRANRGKLIWAYLVLIQNWIAKGQPAYKGETLGSFAAWSKVIGGVFEAAGVTSFNTNRHLIEVDSQLVGLDAFVTAMLDTFGSEWTRVGELKADADEKAWQEKATLVQLYKSLGDAVDLGLKKNPRLDTLGVRLGKVLSGQKGKVFKLGETGSSFALERDEDKHGTLYRLAPKGDAAAKPAGAAEAQLEMPKTRSGSPR